MKPRTKNKMLPTLAGMLLLPALLFAQGNGNGHNGNNGNGNSNHYPQGNGNGNGHDKHHNAPIDGGLSLLLAAGAAVGAKKAHSRKKAMATAS